MNVSNTKIVIQKYQIIYQFSLQYHYPKNFNSFNIVLFSF
jgi:hypothetical protein